MTLTVTHSGNGTGSVASSPTGIDCGADCTLQVAPGTSVTLTATPDANAVFTGWTGGGCSGTDTCVVTVGADTSVDAGFAKKQVNVIVSPTGNGTGTVTSSPTGIACGSTCSDKFDIATQITLTAVAAAGTTFVGWSGGGCDGTTAPCTFTATADTTVQAAFALDDSLVVMLAGTGVGTVTSGDGDINCGANCSAQYAPNTMVTLTAVAGTGSAFASWSGGGCSGTGSCVVTLTAATAVTATFNLVPETLSVTLAGNGAGTVTSAPAGISCGTMCSAMFDYGTMVTLTAAPGTNSTFAGWTGGGCSGTGTCAVTMTAATSVTATFNLQQYTLTVTPSAMGTGSGTVTSFPTGISCGATCAASYDIGTVVTLLADPANGSSFIGWSGGGCSAVSPVCKVTVNAATTVTALYSNIGVYYGVDNSGDFLRIDPSTYAVTTVGSTGTAFAYGDLAWDPSNSTMYMVDGREANALFTINMTTGVATQIGLHGVTDVFALGYYPPNNTLYCIGSDHILRSINPATGVTTAVGGSALAIAGPLEGLFWDAKRSLFVGVAAGNNLFYSINVATATATSIAVPSGSSNDLGAAYNSVADKDVVMDLNGNVYVYDPASAYARTNPASGLPTMAALTFIPPHGEMHAIDGSGNVYAVDSTSYAMTTIGNVGVGFAFGDMTWDPASATMYMVDGRGTKSLYTLNMATGAATLVGAHGVTDMFALGYDPQNDTLYGVGQDNILRKINTTTGATTTIGAALGTSGGIEAMYYDYRRNVMVACTAGSTNLYSLDVTAGTASLLAAEASTNDLGGFYDPFLDAYWAWDYNGNVYRFNPEAAYAGTTVTTGKGTIVAAAITP